MWNKPSEEQLKKYSKGATIKNIFKARDVSDIGTFSNNNVVQVCTIDDVQNITDEDISIASSLMNMIRANY